MMRHLASTLGLALLLSACARPEDSTDTTSVLTIDTLKPATTALQTPDTTAADTAPVTKASTSTKTKGATATTSAKGGTKELGRDSIIRIDTKDKRRQLPLADTTKKP